MAVSIFARCSHLRRFVGMSNAILCPNSGQHLNHVQHAKSGSYTTSINDNDSDNNKIFESEQNKPKKKLNKAMFAYLQRAKEHNAFIRKEIIEYEIGKRHLANMMGEDPDTFTQEDINRSIAYLFPSALYDPKARPSMQHPDKVFPHKKEAEFDESGRPFHFMFYTTKPNYYEILYHITEKMKSLNDIEDSLIKKGVLSMDKIELLGSTWLTKEAIEKDLLENIDDREFTYLITSLERLCDHPLSKRETDFIMKYRKSLIIQSNIAVVEALEHDSTGRPYITVKNCRRKSATAEVTVWGNGSGNIVINGQDITYFKDMRHREQIIFPLMFTDMIDKVDIVATVTNGGPTGQSGAIRWGIAWGLRSFVDKAIIEKMRVAGLLTRDWRRRERKKFGQEGARRKFTWKKR